MKKLSFTLIFIMFLNCMGAFAVPKYFSSDEGKKVPPSPIYNNLVTVPQGYVLSVDGKKSINRSNIELFDKIDFSLKSDFIYNGKLIAPEGSLVKGTVSKMSYAIGEKQAKMLIQFTEILTPDGQNIPISAIFKTDDKNGFLSSDKAGNFDLSGDINIVIMQPVTYISR